MRKIERTKTITQIPHDCKKSIVIGKKHKNIPKHPVKKAKMQQDIAAASLTSNLLIIRYVLFSTINPIKSNKIHFDSV